MYLRPDRFKRPRKADKEKCPFCDKDFKPFDPYRESQCVLNQPLMMVIPPGGVHLSCPIHPEGHHVFGSPVTWMETPMYRENNLPDRWSEPRCIGIGNTDNDLNKFSM